jgi:hypothetical protein
MPNCTYCGKPAGLFRSHHVECRDQHERAVATIPVFFEKMLQSSLAPERFDELLQNVAATSFIDQERLQSLIVAGIDSMMAAALQDHVPTVAEEERIIEIAETLGLSPDDVPGLEDKLVKISVLRDLDEGKIPDRVTVTGPMPIELAPDETIIWIFNNVKSYRQPKAKEGAPAHPSPPPRRNLRDYYSPAELKDQVRTNDQVGGGEVDVLVTNQHFFVVSDDRQRQIPFAKIGTFGAYADGLQISRGATEERTLTFIMDDPWFGANLIARLLRLTPPADGSAQDIDMPLGAT